MSALYIRSWYIISYIPHSPPYPKQPECQPQLVSITRSSFSAENISMIFILIVLNLDLHSHLVPSASLLHCQNGTVCLRGTICLELLLACFWGSMQSIIIHMGVSKNHGVPTSSIKNRLFHYKPSILGCSPHFCKHPTWKIDPDPSARTAMVDPTKPQSRQGVSKNIDPSTG